MTYEKQLTDADCVLRISGEVDMSDAENLKRIEREVGDRPNIIVNAEGLRYVDTTFLRFLLRLREHKNSTQRRSVRVVGASRGLRRVLEITGLSRYFCPVSP